MNSSFLRRICGSSCSCPWVEVAVPQWIPVFGRVRLWLPAGVGLRYSSPREHAHKVRQDHVDTLLSIRRRAAFEMRRQTQRFSLSTQKRRYCQGWAASGAWFYCWRGKHCSGHRALARDLTNALPTLLRSMVTATSTDHTPPGTCSPAGASVNADSVTRRTAPSAPRVSLAAKRRLSA